MNGSPRTGSPAARALWVIVFALLMIAGCLVVMVSRLIVQPPQNTGAAAQQAQAPATTPIQTRPVPPMFRKPQLDRPVIHAPKPVEAPPSQPDSPTPLANDLPALAEDHSPAWQVSGGLAPLTSLKQTNSSPSTISGRITLKGIRPPETVLSLDAFCGKTHPLPRTTRHYMVSTNGGLADVFVFIRGGLEGQKFSASSQTPVLDQKGCEFEPYVLGLMVNQTFELRNSDPIRHNVHALPQSRRNQGFNWTGSQGSTKDESFGAREIPIKLRCDAHPWMAAYVCVTDNPFFAVTDENGAYTITNVPPGNYLVEAYHPKTHGNHTGEIQFITVQPATQATADFAIAVPMTQMTGVTAQAR
jgi:hypothetical protein